MTHKQVEAYLANPNNWHCVQTGDYLQMFVLEFRSIKVAQIRIFACINPWEENRKPLRYDWKPLPNYFEMTGEGIGYTVTETDLKRQIYDAAKNATWTVEA